VTASTHSFGSAELRAGDTKVTIIPALGGKIASMELAGREWLWTSDVLPYRLPTEGASYVETADTGGYDECFPTVAPCTLPAISGRYAALALPNAYSGLALPDHGELWSQPAAFSLETRDDGVYATCGWVGRRMPYRFARALYVSSANRVEMRYAVTNDGLDRLPFVWSSHPLLPLTKHTQLQLPEGARVRVWAEHAINLGGVGAEHRWPRAVAGGKVYDLSRPNDIARAYACKLFVDMTAGRAAVEEEGAQLEVSFDPAEVPQLGLWLNKRGWTPFPRGRPYLNMAFEPCIGAPDSLTEAIGGWKSAAWLEPGETREWTLTWQGRRVL
jgi:galactose mutarotase-like enzyme